VRSSWRLFEIYLRVMNHRWSTGDASPNLKDGPPLIYKIEGTVLLFLSRMPPLLSMGVAVKREAKSNHIYYNLASGAYVP